MALRRDNIISFFEIIAKKNSVTLKKGNATVHSCFKLISSLNL